MILNQYRRKEFWEFRKRYPNAIIAGGYLRDMYLGKAPKDIDVWIPYGEYSRTLDYRTRWASTVTQSQYQRYVSGVYHEGDYEIIEVDWVPETDNKEPFWKFVIDRFDMGICQIAWDGEELYWSEAFKQDVMNKTITYLRTWNEDTKLSRIQRIMEKYPEYTLVDKSGVSDFDFECGTLG